jgi:hypothetical protein
MAHVNKHPSRAQWIRSFACHIHPRRPPTLAPFLKCLTNLQALQLGANILSKEEMDVLQRFQASTLRRLTIEVPRTTEAIGIGGFLSLFSFCARFEKLTDLVLNLDAPSPNSTAELSSEKITLPHLRSLVYTTTLLFHREITLLSLPVLQHLSLSLYGTRDNDYGLLFAFMRNYAHVRHLSLDISNPPRYFYETLFSPECWIKASKLTIAVGPEPIRASRKPMMFPPPVKQLEFQEYGQAALVKTFLEWLLTHTPLRLEQIHIPNLIIDGEGIELRAFKESMTVLFAKFEEMGIAVADHNTT